VAPRDDCTLLAAHEGAFVHVLTLARDEAEYRDKVGAAMNHYCLDILGIEQIAPFSEYSASDDLAAIAEALRQSNNLEHVRFATLNKFPRTMCSMVGTLVGLFNDPYADTNGRESV